MMKKSIIIIMALMFLQFLQPVLAVPPITTIQQFTEGFDIKVHQKTSFHENKSYELLVNIYNISNGVPIYSEISCYFYLYNSSGNAVLSLEADAPSGMFDYSFPIDGEYIQQSLEGYTIHCNNSDLGGYKSVGIVVTPTGIILEEFQGNIALGIIILTFSIMFFFGWISIKFIEGEKTFPVGLFFLLISIILSIYGLYLGVVLSRDYLYASTAEPQSKLFIGILYGLVGMMFLGLLWLVLMAVREIKERKSIQRHGENWNPKTGKYEY